MEVHQKTYICCFRKTYNMKELIIRGISGLLYVSILILSLFASQEIFLILFGILAILSLNELLRLFQLKGYILYVILITALYFLNYKQINNSVIHASLMATFIVNLFLIRELLVTNKTVLSFSKKYIIAIFYLIGGFVFLTLLPFSQTSTFTPKIMIGVFILIWVNDTFAYLIGKNFGKHKLLERISPNKTIEGFFGGLIAASLASYLVYTYIELFTPIIWAIIGLITVLSGTIGDLIQSKFKRQANVKDSGTLMPGHGGMLDRLDSIIFASPFVYTFLILLEYVS